MPSLKSVYAGGARVFEGSDAVLGTEKETSGEYEILDHVGWPRGSSFVTAEG